MQSALIQNAPARVREAGRHCGGLEEVIMLLMERDSEFVVNGARKCLWCGTAFPARLSAGDGSEFCSDCVAEHIPEEVHEFWSDLRGPVEPVERPR